MSPTPYHCATEATTACVMFLFVLPHIVPCIAVFSKSKNVGQQGAKMHQSKAPFIWERNRSVLYRSVPKSGTLWGCVHTGTLEITSFRSNKWNDKISDTKSGTIRNRSVPFRSRVNRQ